jgi:hypothetical protein
MQKFDPYASLNADFSRSKTDFKFDGPVQPTFNFKVSRSQLIKTGVVSFSPYLDENGQEYSPA